MHNIVFYFILYISTYFFQEFMLVEFQLLLRLNRYCPNAPCVWKTSSQFIRISFGSKSIKDKKKQTKSNIKAEFITESSLDDASIETDLMQCSSVTLISCSCRRMQIRNIQYSYRPTYMKATEHMKIENHMSLRL